MKKQISLLLIFLFTLLGCGANSHGARSNMFGSLFNSGQDSNKTTPSSVNFSLDSEGLPVYDKIDVDLTVMSATMVYAQVSNMLEEPSSYRGKIIKIHGPFIPLESTDVDSCYPAILISDATACCNNGLEFLLYGVPRCSMSGGNGYPLYNEEATIVGRFETYLEDALLYVHLVDAVWLKDA